MSGYHIDVTFKPKHPDDECIVERVACRNKAELEARYRHFDARRKTDVLFVRTGHSDDEVEKEGDSG